MTTYVLYCGVLITFEEYKEIECKYNNRHYHRLRVNLPKGNSNRGSFECAYTFGPLCHYDIYIQEVE